MIIREAWSRLDTRMIGLMTTWGIRFMRISLAVIFIWFGLLKVTGHSPLVLLLFWLQLAGTFLVADLLDQLSLLSER